MELAESDDEAFSYRVSDSTSVTFKPGCKRVSHQAVAAPMTPLPTMTTSVNFG
jgi:hypothetical protein